MAAQLAAGMVNAVGGRRQRACREPRGAPRRGPGGGKDRHELGVPNAPSDGGASAVFRRDFPPRPSLPAHAGRKNHPMTTPGTEITTITLRAMRAKLEEAAAIARAAEDLAADGQPGRALMMALDVEPLAVEANSLLQGLAVLSRIVRKDREEPGA
jgi:hypothetical protein